MADARTRLFQWIADRFPSPAIDRDRRLRALWKILFYAVAPKAPFVMCTRRYRLWVHPKKRKDIARAILHRGQYEPVETEIVARRLKPGMTVIDVGANIGHYAMVAAAAVGPEGRIVAFEPEPENFAALAANLALNGFAHARPERLALGARPGELTLYRDAANRGGHSLIRANVQQQAGSSRVGVEALDGYAARHLAGRRIGFIKIDVQGAEAQVLAGAAGVLKRDAPDILLEFWPHGMRAMGGEPIAAIEPLLKLGYAMAAVERGAPGNLRALAGVDALKRIDLGHPQAYVNLLFTKNGAAGPKAGAPSIDKPDDRLV
jgi:FkbM family methyltransferase